MQTVGVVRQQLDPSVIACLMDMLSSGLVNVDTFKSPDDIPPFEVLMDAMAAMLDSFLTPEDGGNREAGKALLLQLAAQARAQFENELAFNCSLDLMRCYFSTLSLQRRPAVSGH